MKTIYTTKSFKQTQKLGEKIAGQILNMLGEDTAVVLELQGNLGGGKTTFLQGFAKGLGIKEKVLSPTFVVFKKFQVPGFRFNYFYHIDCYRLKNEKDILELGFKDIIKDARNIVAIEWPERIKKVLSRRQSRRGSTTKSGPKNTILIEFKFVSKNKREINIKM